MDKPKFLYIVQSSSGRTLHIWALYVVLSGLLQFKKARQAELTLHTLTPSRSAGNPLHSGKFSNSIKDRISEELETPLQYINSALVSAQNRWRFYAHNIPRVEQPEDLQSVVCAEYPGCSRPCVPLRLYAALQHAPQTPPGESLFQRQAFFSGFP